jgi:hypothetical protein
LNKVRLLYLNDKLELEVQKPEYQIKDSNEGSGDEIDVQPVDDSEE